MRSFFALTLAMLVALCGLSEAQPPATNLIHSIPAPNGVGDCVAINSPVPGVGFVAGDSLIPCQPAFLTTVYSNSTGSYTPILSLPPIQAGTTLRGECTLTWEESSTSGTVTFAAQLSGAPAGFWVTASPTSGSFVAPTFTTIANNIQTDITGALATATANAPYTVHLAFVLANTVAANTLTIYAKSNSVSYAVSVEPGSVCAWVP